MNETQRVVLRGLEMALEELAAEPECPAALFDVLGLTGQARRMLPLCGGDARLDAAIAAAEAAIVSAPPAALGVVLRVTPRSIEGSIDALESALMDSEVERVYDAMFDLDLGLCALERAGHPHAASLREEAIGTARICAEAEPELLHLAGQHLSRLGHGGGAAPVWEAILASADRPRVEDLEIEVPDEPIPGWLQDMLAAEETASPRPTFSEEVAELFRRKAEEKG